MSVSKKMKRAESSQSERVRRASRARRDEQKESLRRVILDAAGELFLEHGYEGFSMRRVAERIGYSATTIYRYYENKDDLLFAVVHEGFVEFAGRLMNAAQSASSPSKQLEALGRAYVEFGLENPVYYQMMFMQRADLMLERQREDTEPMRGSFEVLVETVRRAIAAGVLRQGDAETYSHVIWSLVHGITALALANPTRFTKAVVEKNTRMAMKMMMDGLRKN